MQTREPEAAIASAPPAGAQTPGDAGPDADAPRRGPRKRVIGIVAGSIAAILILIWGIGYLAYARTHEGTDDARVDADVVAVTSKIGERIDQILVDTNQSVKKGQLLVVMDDADEKAKLSQAQAQLDLALANQRTNTEQGQGGVLTAQAAVANAQTGVPTAQAGVAQAQAQLVAAQAGVPAAQQSYSRAAADLARIQSLVGTGDLPAQQLDAARAEEATAGAQLQTASAQIDVAQANLAAAQSKVPAAGAGVQSAQGGLQSAQGKLAQNADPSNVESARAQYDLARQSLAYTHIFSPIDGYVGEKSAEVGQTVSPGLTLMTLIPQNGIFITANFKETQVGNMRPGQPVDIKVDAYPGITFTGKVVSINPASQNTYALVPAQNATGNFVKVTQRIPVRISIDNPDPNRPLRPGMSVEAYVKVR
ncbi:MAG: HlyD family secretion protein [Vulcanimicrobiaceae bacterium]